MSFPTVDAKLTPLGFRVYTVSGVGRLNAPDSGKMPVDAAMVLLKVTGDTARFRDDGTPPTTAVGYPKAADDEFWYTGDLSALRFIQDAAGSPVIHALFYKGGA